MYKFLQIFHEDSLNDNQFAWPALKYFQRNIFKT